MIKFIPSLTLSGLSLVIVSIFTLSSCKSTKTIQAAVSKKDTTAVVLNNQSAEDSLAIIHQALQSVHGKEVRDFRTFAATIKAEYEDNKGKQPKITAYVRIIKDSVIWISGYATVFNIEAFRVLIKKDSVTVMDKINKVVQYRSMDYLQEVTEIPFDFYTLQNLFVGNPVFLEDSVVSYKETETKILLATVGQYFKHLLTIEKGSGNLLHSKLDDININRNRTADITYSDFESSNGHLFSTFREIIVSEKNKLDITLNYKQWEFNKELQIVFNVPKNYKRN